MKLIRTKQDKNRAFEILEQAFQSSPGMNWMLRDRNSARSKKWILFTDAQFRDGAYLTSDRNGVVLSLRIGFGRVEMNKIIADTPFFSIEDLEERFESWEKPIEVPFAGFDKNNEPLTAVTAAPSKNLKSVKLIIGSNDNLFKKEIYVVENPDRKDHFSVNEKEYTEIVLSFLKS